MLHIFQPTYNLSGLAVGLLVGSIPGVIIGSLLATRTPDRILRPILASTLALVGAKLLF